MRPFPWTGRRTRAAQLVAEDLLSDSQIAAEVGVTKKSLELWKRHPIFAGRVQSIVDQIASAVLAQGIANKQNRVDALNRRAQLMWQVIAERAEDKEMDEAAGGKTGLMVRQWKQVGVGKDAQLVSEFAVDTGLLKEMREHEKQAAQELEQWKEGTGLLKYLDLTKLTDEQLERLAHGDDPIKALLGR